MKLVRVHVKYETGESELSRPMPVDYAEYLVWCFGHGLIPNHGLRVVWAEIWYSEPIETVRR